MPEWVAAIVTVGTTLLLIGGLFLLGHGVHGVWRDWTGDDE
jgi:hypothetical protein